MSEKEARHSVKRLIKMFIRVGVSAALVLFLYYKVDSRKLIEALRSLSLETFLLVSFLYLIGQILSALKWRILVNSVKIIRPVSQFIRAYIFGMFVNTFGFGTVGGDVARAVALKPARGERAAAFATVIADRIHGLGVLLAIGSVSITLYRPEAFPAWAIVLAASSTIGIALFWWLGPKLLLYFFQHGHSHHTTALQATKAFPHEPRTFFLASLISAVFHSLQIFMVFAICQELGTNVPLAYLFCVVPIVNTIATLPFSIQGIGVRESLYGALLAAYGVSQETAVALGAIWLLTTSVVSGLGGVILVPDLVRASDKILKDEDPAEIIDLNQARVSRQKRG